jgi:hypothetical protein
VLDQNKKLVLVAPDSKDPTGTGNLDALTVTGATTLATVTCTDVTASGDISAASLEIGNASTFKGLVTAEGGVNALSYVSQSTLNVATLLTTDKLIVNSSNADAVRFASLTSGEGTALVVNPQGYVVKSSTSGSGGAGSFTTLAASGAVTFAGTLDVAGAATFDDIELGTDGQILGTGTSHITIGGAIIAGGGATIGGTTICHNVDIDTNLNVAGAATFTGAVTLSVGAGTVANLLAVDENGVVITTPDVGASLAALQAAVFEKMDVSNVTAVEPYTAGGVTYQPNLWQLHDTVSYQALDHKRITFSGTAAGAIYVDLGGIGATDIIDFSGIVDNTAAGIHVKVTSTADITNCIGFQNLKGVTSAGSVTVSGGATLTMTTRQASGAYVVGSGGGESLTVVCDEGAATGTFDLANIGTAAFAAAKVSTVAGAAFTFTPAMAFPSGLAVEISGSEALTLPVALAAGRTITRVGAGTLTLTNFASTPAADLSGVAAAIPVTFSNVSNTVTATGTFGANPYILAAGVTLTSTAAKLTGKTFSGAGTLAVTAGQATLAGDFSNVTTVGKTLDFALAASVTYSGTITSATVTVSGAHTLTVTGTYTGSSFAVAAGSTLSGTAAKLSGTSATGAGTIAVTALQATLAADLSNLAVSSVTAAMTIGGATTLSASLGKAALTLTGAHVLTYTGAAGTGSFAIPAGATLSAAAAVIDGIATTGAGTTAVTAYHAAPAADLSALATAVVTAAAPMAAHTVFSGAIGAAVVALSGAYVGTFTGSFATGSFTVALGTTLAGSAAALTGATALGIGTCAVADLAATPAADLIGLSTATVTADLALTAPLTLSASIGRAAVAVSGAHTATFTGEMGQQGSFVIAAGSTVSSTAAILSGRTTSGAGSTTVTALESTLAADLSSLASTTVSTTLVMSGATALSASLGKTVVALSGAHTCTFTGVPGTGSFSVASGSTLTATAAVLTGRTTFGAGTTAVTALQATLAANLANLATTSVTAELEMGAPVILAAALGSAAVAVSGAHLCTFTGTRGSGSFTVAAGSSLTATAAILTGATVSGAGSCAVTALQSTLAADLSTISCTTFTAAAVLGSSVSFTGDLGNAALSLSGAHTLTVTGSLGTASIAIAAGATLAATAAILSGRTTSGAGTTAISALHSTLAAELSNIASAVVTAAFTGPATYTGTLPTGASTTVTVSTGTLTIVGSTSAAQCAGKIFNGAGLQVAVEIANASSANLATWTGTANQLVTFTSSSTFSGSLALGGSNAKAIAIANGQTVTTTAAIASGRTITGTTGSMVITDLQSSLAADLSLIALTSGTLTATVTATPGGNAAANPFTGYLKSATGTIKLDIASGAEFAVTESRAREVVTYTDAFGSANKTTGRRPGKSVSKFGDGLLIIDDVSNANRKVTNITESGTSLSVKFTDTDLTAAINGDGRSAGDNVATATDFTVSLEDGSVQVNNFTTVTK